MLTAESLCFSLELLHRKKKHSYYLSPSDMMNGQSLYIVALVGLDSDPILYYLCMRPFHLFCNMPEFLSYPESCWLVVWDIFYFPI